MGSVFKPLVLGKNGKKHRSEFYRLAYREAGKRRVVNSECRDRKNALEKLRQLELRAERLRLGLPVEGQGHSRKLLTDVLAGHLAELRRLGRQPKYVTECRCVVEAAISGCRWKTLGDVSQESLRTYLSGLADAGKAPGTINDARGKVLSLLAFAKDQDWLAANPCEGVKTSTGKGPRAKRALTPDELARLLAASPKRRAIYAVAALSGLRRYELQRLEKRDVVLDPAPYWRLRAEATKTKTAAIIEMFPECAATLRPFWVAAQEPTDLLFRRVPGVRTFDADLKRAGIAKRVGGRIASFHGLRMTFCTNLAKVMPIIRVKDFMRHATLALTSDLYCQLGLRDAAEVTGQLPVLRLPAPKEGQPAA